jgi:hypothetical protein
MTHRFLQGSKAVHGFPTTDLANSCSGVAWNIYNYSVKLCSDFYGTDSLPCLNETIYVPYQEPAESSPDNHFSYVPFNITLSYVGLPRSSDLWTAICKTFLCHSLWFDRRKIVGQKNKNSEATYYALFSILLYLFLRCIYSPQCSVLKLQPGYFIQLQRKQWIYTGCQMPAVYTLRSTVFSHSTVSRGSAGWTQCDWHSNIMIV